MDTPVTSDVQTLFNSKARCWQSKYGPGGALNSRLEQFTNRLSGLCLPPGNILELGCGTGEFATAICQEGYRVTACDIAEDMLEVARHQWTGIPVEWLTLKPDWTRLPFEDRSFDAIVSSSVFEYLVDLRRALMELARVLRPGGVLIFSVPNPYNRTRKLEAWFQTIFLSRMFMPLLYRIRGLKSYLTYLQLSQNRFMADRWESILDAAGFRPMNKREFSHERWVEQSTKPLILLAVKKVTTSESYSS